MSSHEAIPLSDSPDLAARLTAMESTIAHLQHDYDQLHEVALTLQADVRQLRQFVEKMASQMEQLSAEPEVRSAEMERPPHY